MTSLLKKSKIDEGICIICGNPCEKIGKKNKIGFPKRYCCECFAEKDPDFVGDLWCETCDYRRIKKLTLCDLCRNAEKCTRKMNTHSCTSFFYDKELDEKDMFFLKDSLGVYLLGISQSKDKKKVKKIFSRLREIEWINMNGSDARLIFPRKKR